MSSFASRAREEIAQRSIQKDCCVRAAAYGIACFAKYFDAKGLVVQTEQQETVQAAQQLFARCGVQGEILHKQRPSGVLYEFNIRAPEQVARVHQPADRPPPYPLSDLRQCVHWRSFFVQWNGH